MRLATRPERTADELWVLVSQLLAGRQVPVADIEGVVLASVVPALTRTVVGMLAQGIGREALVVCADNAGLPVRYDNPAEIGADRLVNGVAACALYGAQSRSVVVVDFGTATTFDAVSPRRGYLGGIICPGVDISADALFQRAARLPRVEVSRPPELIGRTTVASMQSGLFHGHVAMVEGIVARLRHALREGRRRRMRGHGAAWLAPSRGETAAIDEVNPDLTLIGLQLVWGAQRRRACRPVGFTQPDEPRRLLPRRRSPPLPPQRRAPDPHCRARLRPRLRLASAADTGCGGAAGDRPGGGAPRRVAGEPPAAAHRLLRGRRAGAVRRVAPRAVGVPREAPAEGAGRTRAGAVVAGPPGARDSRTHRCAGRRGRARRRCGIAPGVWRSGSTPSRRRQERPVATDAYSFWRACESPMKRCWPRRATQPMHRCWSVCAEKRRQNSPTTAHASRRPSTTRRCGPPPTACCASTSTCPASPSISRR